MLNLNLKPWNIYNNLDNPQLGVSSNVFIDNKEWFNSYMPCFFDMDDFDIMKKLKDEIDTNSSNPKLIKDSIAFNRYLDVLKKYQNPDRLSAIILSLKDRINKCFENEKKLLDCKNADDTFISKLGIALAGINLNQECMDPVEVLTSMKASHLFNSFEKKVSELVDLNVLNRTPSSEVAFIPMVVLTTSGVKNNSLTDVIEFYKNLFQIKIDRLYDSMEYANKLYNYQKFMPCGVAQKIIDKTSEKICNLESLTHQEYLMYRFQELNGLFTWSKYILQNKRTGSRRFDATNNILVDLVKDDYVKNDKNLTNMLAPKTVSASEKQAIIIYLINHISENNPEMHQEIKLKAESYYNLSKK